MSPGFQIGQGVRQGGILSTTHYKLFNNNLLSMIEDLNIGAQIGCLNVSAPTCADDVAALGNNSEHVQWVVDMVRGYTSRERYCINPKKSEEIVLNRGKRGAGCDSIRYGDESILKVQSAVHLGIDRSKSPRPDIQKKVQLGRRTLYSLMGAGVYGGSGLNPVISAHLWKIYVLPRMLFGLEVQKCLLVDVAALEHFQRSTFRKINLSPKTRLFLLCIVYLVSGRWNRNLIYGV